MAENECFLKGVFEGLYSNEFKAEMFAQHYYGTWSSLIAPKTGASSGVDYGLVGDYGSIGDYSVSGASMYSELYLNRIRTD